MSAAIDAAAPQQEYLYKVLVIGEFGVGKFYLNHLPKEFVVC